MPEAKEKNQSDSSKAKPANKPANNNQEQTAAAKDSPASPVQAPAASENKSSKAGLVALVALLLGGSAWLGGYSVWQEIKADIDNLSQRASVNEKEIAGYAASSEGSRAVADTVQNTNKLLQNRLDTLDSKVDTQVNELSSKLDTKLGQLQNDANSLKSATDSSLSQLNAKDEAMSDSIDSLAAKIKTNLNDRWLVTEAANLITIANQQAMLNHDAASAISALEAADQRLREAADPALLAARQALTDDIIALRGISQLDVTGIALTLSKLEKDVAQLPLKNEVPQAAAEPAAAEAESEGSGVEDFASKIWGDIKGLVTVRRSFDSTSPALLPPGQKFFLEQNLRLKLQGARLALLNRDSQVFQDSIATSTAWLDEYFDGSAAATANLKSSLAPYSSLDLNPALPDISRTLSLLEEWQSQQDSGEANS